jgi:hypothetical protein
MERERQVWKGTNENSCVAICKRFREEEVGFRVEQHAFTYGKGDVVRSFAIIVPAEFEDDAKAIVAEFGLPEDDSYDNDDDGGDLDESNSLPEAPDGVQDVLTAEERARRERSPRLDEDMDVEIWRDTAEADSAVYVKTCLRENEIGCRIEKG